MSVALPIKEVRGNGSISAAACRDSFDAHWELSGQLLDEPNRRRGGWSRVERVDGYPRAADRRPITVCIKKQCNHKRHSLAHPLGVLTYANEVAMMEVFRGLGIRVPEVAFFATRGERGILATVFLEGHTALTDLLLHWREDPARTRPQRREVIAKLAATARRMHDARVMHYSLYPKHIFLRDEDLEPCLIDLELSKKCWLRRSCTLRDLDVLNRHTPTVSRTDKLRFLLLYAGQERVSCEVRRLWHAISNRSRKR